MSLLLPKFDIIDGGYLSWVFGQQWGQSSWPPPYVRDTVVMMDSREPTFREQRDKSYKQNRRDKRADNLFLQKQQDRISIFRETMHDDPRVHTVLVPGLEADDLVVLAAWSMWREYEERCVVLGKDKDLLQAGKHMLLYDHKGEKIRLSTFQRRLPKSIQKPPFKFRHIPLCLAIMGDQSDNIPRLVLPRQLWTARDILFESGYKGARKEFGNRFLRNLHQVILPDPECFGYNKKKVYDLVKKGKWGPNLLDELRPWIKKEVDSWPLQQRKS